MGLLAQRQAYATGLLQKQDPLPPGRYWIDASGDANVASLNQWLEGNSPFVAVENAKTVGEPSLSWNDAWWVLVPGGSGWVLAKAASKAAKPSEVYQEWVLFRVHDVPVPWGLGPVLGYPTIATADVKEKSDTVQRPPEQSASDFWFGSEGKFPWAPYAIFAGLLVGIVAVVRK